MGVGHDIKTVKGKVVPVLN